MPRVLVVRGHLVTPWELGPWLELPSHYEVRCLLTGSNRFQAPTGVDFEQVRALRDVLPHGIVGDLVARAVGDRYLSSPAAFAWADIVHAEELPFWFSADAARRRARHRFRLVQTVWETLPLLDTFRSPQARRNRRAVLAATDLFLPTTERAAAALRLEGVGEERIRVCPPGIDVDRFAASGGQAHDDRHLIVSPGRLVWEKGHHDVLRAVALLHRGIVTVAGATVAPRVQIIGAGPEEPRLRAYAAELGLDACEIVAVPYAEMPARFAAASAMVLASQGSAAAAYHPLGIPHVFWEEQFGMVLAEAMASGLEIVATTSGAIPEVLEGSGARMVAPGDWDAMARALADGALRRPPGTRVPYPPELVSRYSAPAAGRRLTDAYDAVLG